MPTTDPQIIRRRLELFTAKRSNSPLVSALGVGIISSGLTFAEVHEKAGVSRGAIRKWMYGHQGPQLFLFEAVANAAGYDLKLVKRDAP